MEHFRFNWKPREIIEMSLLYFYSVILFFNISFMFGNALRRHELEEDVARVSHGEAPGTGRFRPLPYPVDFAFYDVNRDNFIALEELIVKSGKAENVEQAFAASDLNGDGIVTRTEYHAKPWGYDPSDIVLQEQ